MTSAIQRAFSCLPAMPSLSSAASTTASFLRRGFSFLSYQNALTAMRGVTLAALGYDVYHDNQLLSLRSPTLISTTALLALYSAPWLVRQGAVQILKRLPEPIGLLAAIKLGDLQLVDELIRSGANVNAQDPISGLIPLHYAYQRCNTVMIRMLVAAGANPFALNREGDSLMGLATLHDNLHLLKTLTRTENHRAFQDCRTIHDFFSILFPPSTRRLPSNWREVVARVPPAPELEELRREAEHLALAREDTRLNPSQIPRPYLVGVAVPAQIAAADSGGYDKNPNCVVDAILTRLQEVSPLFAKAWALANREQRITLEEVTHEAILSNGANPGSSGAAYCPIRHRIRISKDSAPRRQVLLLIFETINALQRSSVGRVVYGLGREELALSCEWIEKATAEWTAKIVRELGENIPATPPFEELWVERNTLPSVAKQRIGERICHTDVYRRFWDRIHSSVYLSRNQDLLRRRLEELRRTA